MVLKIPVIERKIGMESLKGKFGAKPTRSRHCEEENNPIDSPTASPAKREGGDCSLTRSQETCRKEQHCYTTRMGRCSKGHDVRLACLVNRLCAFVYLSIFSVGEDAFFICI